MLLKLLLTLPLFLLGCAEGLRPAPAPAPPPASVLPSDFKARRGRLLDLSARVELHVESYLDNYNGEALLLLKREASLRLEPLDFFGRPLLYLAANSGGLSAYLPGRRRYYRGSASPENLELWLGVPLELRHIVAILWADLPIMENGARMEILPDERDRVFELRVRSGGALAFQSLRIEMGSLNPVRAILETRGGEQLLVQYGDYFEVKGIPVPGRVEVSFLRQEKTLRLFYRTGSVRINRGLEDRLFELPVPRGLEITPLSRGG